MNRKAYVNRIYEEFKDILTAEKRLPFVTPYPLEIIKIIKEAIEELKEKLHELEESRATDAPDSYEMELLNLQIYATSYSLHSFVYSISSFLRIRLKKITEDPYLYSDEDFQVTDDINLNSYLSEEEADFAKKIKNESRQLFMDLAIEKEHLDEHDAEYGVNFYGLDVSKIVNQRAFYKIMHKAVPVLALRTFNDKFDTRDVDITQFVEGEKFFLNVKDAMRMMDPILNDVAKIKVI